MRFESPRSQSAESADAYWPMIDFPSFTPALFESIIGAR